MGWWVNEPIINRILKWALPILSALLLANTVGAAETIRIGVHDKPPLVQVADTEHVSGFIIDLMNLIAREEGWQIEYVP
jgi:ABC-type amino acid transport substrate-binding protein